jgi:hypothetical protein
LRFQRSFAGVRGCRAALLLLATALTALDWRAAGATTYYVRQTVGDDANDGLTPATAWKHFSRLSPVMDEQDGAGGRRGEAAVELVLLTRPRS